MNDEAVVAQVLADYYRAFSTLSLDAVVPYFHEPALMLGPPGVFAVPTSAALIAIVGPAMEDLRARGYGRSEFEPKRIKQLSAATASASGVAVRYKTDGQVLERVGITYLLQKTESHWKIAVMVVHDIG